MYNEVQERIEVFDSAAQFLAVRSRKGGGPGEYQYVGSLSAQPDGTLLIVDRGKGAVVGFDPRGAVLPERSFVALGRPIGGIAFVGDTVVIHERQSDGQRQPRHTIRWIAPALDTVLLSAVLPTQGEAQFQCAEGPTITLSGVEQLLAPIPSWALGPGLVAIAIGDVYNVAVFAGGRLRQLIRRPLKPILATTDHVRRQYPDGIALFQGRSCRQRADELVAQQGLAEHLPLVRSLRYAPDGSLWVQRFTLPGDASVTDVYSPDGTYQGSVAGVGVPAGFASGGRLLGLVADPATGGYHAYFFHLDPAPW